MPQARQRDPEQCRLRQQQQQLQQQQLPQMPLTFQLSAAEQLAAADCLCAVFAPVLNTSPVRVITAISLTATAEAA
ncbi:hypothetical protein ENH_00027610 [Eimeria necatrix]|uniref:Uncharacterized protein n=1 Tax=Eimeria necatrix TaxID=51315 RepID=U6MRT3_9EIME|nr:hypothetical protein ENH_00027610 [Eimeria necatrix]CDJ66927.1 hypothetical protein ENH_00027610 [Eimeria necatrix]